MVLVGGRQGIAGSKVHPTEWRGGVFFCRGDFLEEQGISGEVLKYFPCRFSPYFGDEICNGTMYISMMRMKGGVQFTGKVGMMYCCPC